MKTFRILTISSMVFFFILSCKQSGTERLKEAFSGETGKKWYSYSIDSIHCSQAFYPFRVFEFFEDGRQIQYINNATTRKLDTIPKDDRYNPERWFIVNDSTVSIETERNPISGYHHKQNSKVLFYNKDTIILQGTKRSNYEGVIILTRYK